MKLLPPNIKKYDNKGRQSNIEILRILSMIFVLTLHYIPTRLMPDAETIHTNFNEFLINMELRSIAFVGVNCFILISGFFGISWKLKSFSNLIYRVLFWSFVAFIIIYIITPLVFDQPFIYPGEVLSNIWTLRWFIGAYLLLYLFAPVLNSFINNTTQKELGGFLLAFYITSTIFGWILKSHEFNEGMSMIHLSGLYFIGAYLKRYKLKILQFKALIDLAIYLLLGLILLICGSAAYYVGFTKSIYGYTNPLVVIQSVYLFLFFSKLKLNNIKIVNLFAASAFSVYLFHTDICCRPLYTKISNDINDQGILLSLPLVLLFFIGIFTICVAVDWIGNFIFNYLFNNLVKRSDLSKSNSGISAT